MRNNGLHLTPEDIYSINKSSLKDAVVIFGSGCTGEIISNEGLLITNYHCGYGAIQSLSSVENDYLTYGFWAKTKTEELPVEDLTVTFLIRMEDVTNKVLEGVNDNMDEIERQTIINKNINAIKKSSIEGTHYNATIKPFFYGNEYYLIITETFYDIRLVGAPPSGIGKFGGDADNWMWPRHTGDFSLFRIYTDSTGKPAKYSKNNIPYKPKKSLTISLRGVKEGDFTMVIGYPGTTKEYLFSDAIKMQYEIINPIRIKARTKKLEIINEAMNKSNDLRIKYSAKQSGIANGWKKWIGENRGIKRTDIIDKKQMKEREYEKWINSDNKRKLVYGDLINNFRQLYTNIAPLLKINTYIFEAGMGSGIIDLCAVFRNLVEISSMENPDETDIQQSISEMLEYTNNYFKDYDIETDKKLFSGMLEIMYNDCMKEYYPNLFNEIKNKYNGVIQKYTDYIYSKSIFSNENAIKKLLTDYKPTDKKKILKDPAYQYFNSIISIYFQYIQNKLDSLQKLEQKYYRTYINLIKEFNTKNHIYPDANMTMRIAYGKIKGYEPYDAVTYRYYTTIDGIIEKNDSTNYDYTIPEKLKSLYINKDFGQYSTNGTIPVCFIATNHTTGGNSGSPVLDGYGNLIGINFDRNWEGTMSDIVYDESLCRNIIVDIRYVLFVIEKYAEATNILNELTIIQ